MRFCRIQGKEISFKAVQFPTPKRELSLMLTFPHYRKEETKRRRRRRRIRFVGILTNSNFIILNGMNNLMNHLHILSGKLCYKKEQKTMNCCRRKVFTKLHVNQIRIPMHEA